MAKAQPKALPIVQETRPVGRPTLYQPEYCDGVVEFMGKGYSLTAYAGEIGVDRDTLVEWTHRHQDFSVAVKRGKAARTKCLETTLLLGETGPKVTAHIFALKNAAPAEWRDRIEHSGPDGGAIPVAQTFDLRALAPAEREQLMLLMRQAAAKPVEQIEGSFTAEDG